jgi:hypothetical protein
VGDGHVLTTKFVGQVITGGMVSMTTTTVKSHCATTPPLAITVQWTGCDPGPNGVVGGGVQLTLTCKPGQLFDTTSGYGWATG